MNETTLHRHHREVVRCSTSLIWLKDHHLHSFSTILFVSLKDAARGEYFFLMAAISTCYHNCSDPNNSDLKSKPEKRRGNVTYQPELIQRVFKLDEYDERSREQRIGYVIRSRFFLFFSSLLISAFVSVRVFVVILSEFWCRDFFFVLAEVLCLLRCDSHDGSRMMRLCITNGRWWRWRYSRIDGDDE